MSRIPTHTVEDAPEASRPLLQKIAQSSPTGRPLNLHAQMAHSPAVLAAYTSLRAVIAEHGALGPKVSWALNLATAVAVGNDNMIDALTLVVREAAANSGNVTDITWKTAQQGGWGDAELAEAFAHLGLTMFTGYFLNYAQTDTDV